MSDAGGRSGGRRRWRSLLARIVCRRHGRCRRSCHLSRVAREMITLVIVGPRDVCEA